MLFTFDYIKEANQEVAGMMSDNKNQLFLDSAVDSIK